MTYTDGKTTACTSDGSNVILVKFWNNFGDLPKLQASLDGVTSLLIQADGEGPSIRGTKEDAVCSNRGVCDHFTGLCRCYYGFTSSNGNGFPGTRGDCGYIEPIYQGSAGQVVNQVQ